MNLLHNRSAKLQEMTQAQLASIIGGGVFPTPTIAVMPPPPGTGDSVIPPIQNPQSGIIQPGPGLIEALQKFKQATGH